MAKKKTTTAARAAAPTTNATGNRRTIVAVVSDAQHDAAEQVIGSFDTVHGTAFAGGWTAWRPGWDSFDPPEPPTPLCWSQIYPFTDLDEAALFVQAMTSMAGIGVRWYEALVVPEESGNPCNTIDSVFDDGYNAGLPVQENYAGVAAWLLDMGQPLPARSLFPTL